MKLRFGFVLAAGLLGFMALEGCVTDESVDAQNAAAKKKKKDSDSDSSSDSSSDSCSDDSSSDDSSSDDSSSSSSDDSSSCDDAEPCDEAHSLSSTGNISCGGFPGTVCPGGLTCIDDPSDACDPMNGGADCIGICQDLIYVGFSPEECAVIKFGCDPGYGYFLDECGCGCQYQGLVSEK